MCAIPLHYYLMIQLHITTSQKTVVLTEKLLSITLLPLYIIINVPELLSMAICSTESQTFVT